MSNHWDRIAANGQQRPPVEKRKKRRRSPHTAKPKSQGKTFWKSPEGQQIIAARRAQADWSGLDRWGD